MKVRLLSSIREIEEISPEWRAIFKESNDKSVFSCWEWMKTYLDCMIGEDDEIFCIVAEDKGEVVGIAPLKIKTEIRGFLKKRILTFLVSETVDYMNFLYNSNVNVVTFLKKIIEMIKDHQAKWDFIELKGLSSANQSTFLLSAAFSRGKLEKNIMCSDVATPYFYIRDPEDFLVRKVIQDIKRCQRKLETQGKLEFHINETITQPCWDNFCKLHKIVHPKGNFTKESSQKFYRKLFENPQFTESIEFSYLTLDDEFIAGHFGFIDEQKIYYYVPTYNQDYRNLGVGLVLLKRIVEHYHAKNINILDMLRGDEAYKFKWATHSNYNYNFYCTGNGSLYNYLYIMVFATFRNNPLIGDIYRKIRGTS